MPMDNPEVNILYNWQKECAIMISDTNSRILKIRKQIETNSGGPTEEDILFEKIRNIDLPIQK